MTFPAVFEDPAAGLVLDTVTLTPAALRYQPCEADTTLTDAELVAIVRRGLTAAAESVDPFNLTSVCELSIGHPGRHASLQAAFGNHRPEAWLRWDGTGRLVEWHVTPGCLVLVDGAACVHFKGHPGDHYPEADWLAR
jgi:hypothetical protein